MCYKFNRHTIETHVIDKCYSCRIAATSWRTPTCSWLSCCPACTPGTYFYYYYYHYHYYYYRYYYYHYHYYYYYCYCYHYYYYY